MISLGGVSTLTAAQNVVDGAARKIAQGSTEPQDVVDLMQGREQFSAGTKVVHVEDQMTQSLLNILG